MKKKASDDVQQSQASTKHLHQKCISELCMPMQCLHAAECRDSNILAYEKGTVEYAVATGKCGREERQGKTKRFDAE